MTRKEKLKARIYSLPRDLRWEEMVAFLSNEGFIEVPSSGGSHRKFYSKIYGVYISAGPKPHGAKQNVVRVFYIKQVIEILDKLGCDNG